MYARQVGVDEFETRDFPWKKLMNRQKSTSEQTARPWMILQKMHLGDEINVRKSSPPPRVKTSSYLAAEAMDDDRKAKKLSVRTGLGRLTNRCMTSSQARSQI